MKHNNKFVYPRTMRETIDGKRHYNINDKEKLPSVTTILKATESDEKKAALEKWKKRVHARCLHHMCRSAYSAQG